MRRVAHARSAPLAPQNQTPCFRSIGTPVFAESAPALYVPIVLPVVPPIVEPVVRRRILGTTQSRRAPRFTGHRPPPSATPSTPSPGRRPPQNRGPNPEKSGER